MWRLIRKSLPLNEGMKRSIDCRPGQVFLQPCGPSDVLCMCTGEGRAALHPPELPTRPPNGIDAMRHFAIERIAPIGFFTASCRHDKNER